MQKRIMVCLAGGVVGMAAASRLGDSWGMSPVTAFVGFVALGLGFGYIISVVLDVFSGNVGNTTPHAED